MSEVTIPFMSRLKAIRDRMTIQAEAETIETAAPVSAAVPEVDAPPATASELPSQPSSESLSEQSLGNMWAFENEPEVEARAPAPEAVAEAEPAGQPEPPLNAKAEQEIDTAPKAAPELEPAAQIAPEPDVKAEPAVTAKAEPEIDANSETAPAPETNPTPTAEAEPEVEALSVWEGVDEPDEVELTFAGRTETTAPGEAVDESGEAERPMRRAGRTKTRLLSVDHADGKPAVDLFAKAKSTQAHNLAFPYGWLVVVEGPGRGEYISVQAGVSQIGRDEDQAVQLDFGDMSISRHNHAAIAYDEEEASFFIGHGGKSNLVRLNGKPLLSTELVKSGDKIRIGETTLRLITLCGPDFSWVETVTSPNDNG